MKSLCTCVLVLDKRGNGFGFVRLDTVKISKFDTIQRQCFALLECFSSVCCIAAYLTKEHRLWLCLHVCMFLDYFWIIIGAHDSETSS